MNLLRAEGLTKSFGKRTVVKQVSFEVNDGEIVGLLGQNGAGKSTSFNMIYWRSQAGQRSGNLPE